MICTNCHQAFNGSDRICHICGTEHPMDYPPKPVIEHAVIESPETAVIKKKSHKKGAK